MEIISKPGRLTVLIVEDNLRMAAILKDLLVKIEYLDVLDIAENGLKAVWLIKSLSPVQMQ